MFDEQEPVTQEAPTPAPQGNMPNVTVQQMDELVAKLMQERAESQAMKDALTEKNKGIQKLESQVVLALKQLERDNYRSKAGTVSISQQWRVNVPTSVDDKKALFKWLKDKGILWQYATVQSNSLKSLFLEEWEHAKLEGEGMDFKIPGVGEPKLYEQLQVRKG